MADQNPKHNPNARRKMRGKWIGGMFIPYHLLMEAQKRRIELLQKEIIRQTYKRLPFWIRLKLRIQWLWLRLCQKIKSKLRI